MSSSAPWRVADMARAMEAESIGPLPETIAGVSIVRDGDFAGVVAPTERAARRAAAAVEAKWTPAAPQPSSSTIYDHLKKVPDAARAPSPFTAGNVAEVKAARSFDASYRIPYIAHVPLEPRAAVAEWTEGKLTVWTGTQRPFGVRTELAEAFRIPENRVRVSRDGACGAER